MTPHDQLRPCIVYSARCDVNGKLYFGIRKHINTAKRGSHYIFHAALRKYGASNFVWTVCEITNWRGACASEIRLIEEHDTCNQNKGYNTAKGGNGTLGFSLPTETRRKISSSLKAWHASGDPKAQALRAKVSHVRRTMETSLATRLKRAEVSRGRGLSKESRSKLRASKRKYSDAIVAEATNYAKQHGYRAAERAFNIPRPTIRRWSRTPEEQDEARRLMRENHRKRQYGYAFPLVGP
jgi:group I intron endonuclease